MEQIFPELAESEDERIANAIKKHLDMKKSERNLTGYFGVSYQEAVAWLEKQGKEKEYTFKPIPRLLEMIEPTSKAKAYCQKLIDTLTREGYATDAKIVGECLKKMNGEKVALATMDEKQDGQKPKWKQSDDIRFSQLYDFLVNKTPRLQVDCNEYATWLNSLKQRML